MMTHPMKGTDLMTPEELEAIRAERNAALDQLRIDDPILWLIVIQPRGEKALIEAIVWPAERVRRRIEELLHTKLIKRARHMGHTIYRSNPDNRELKRLAKRALNIKYTNRKEEKQNDR
jgi:hypothetical protein